MLDPKTQKVISNIAYWVPTALGIILPIVVVFPLNVFRFFLLVGLVSMIVFGMVMYQLWHGNDIDYETMISYGIGSITFILLAIFANLLKEYKREHCEKLFPNNEYGQNYCLRKTWL